MEPHCVEAQWALLSAKVSFVRIDAADVTWQQLKGVELGIQSNVDYIVEVDAL